MAANSIQTNPGKTNQNKTAIIKNGYVFDPLNTMNGVVMDIFIKDGKIVSGLSGPETRDATVIDARQGEIVSMPEGRRYYCQPYVDETVEKEMMADVNDWFKYYTVGFANYPVPEKYLKNPVAISVNMPLEAVARR